MTSVKIVVLGGSGVATPELAAALAAIPGRSVPLQLVLVGRNAPKLELVAGVARLVAGNDSMLSITHTTDAERALDGADYVLNQIRVGGLAARFFDESFPRAIGLAGEETTGAGGFANASRTIPVVLSYARMIERLAPRAQMLSFANPASVVQYAITRYTNMATLGMCEMPMTMTEQAARSLGVPAASLQVEYMGMHHFGWITGLWLHGEDVLPQALQKAAQACPTIAPAIVQAMGALPTPYLRYVFHPDKMLARQAGQRTRAEELMVIEADILTDYERCLASGQPPTALARRDARWYRMIIAPVLAALIEGRQGANPAAEQRFMLNLTNGQTLPWLASDAIIEAPTVISGGRICPLAARPAPAAVQALIQLNCTYEMEAVEAIVERDRTKALRALLLNPMIRTYDQAAATLEQAWGAGQSYA